ncbi:MAG: tetratricopeptide repeat protein [Acidobacteria bacterium]|nr:tetratricopeptide repeat protein [Acidobacteriota bacterium]
MSLSSIRSKISRHVWLRSGWVVLCFLVSIAPILRGQRGAALDAEKAQIASGDYQQAIAALEKAVSKTPDNGEAVALLIRARIETGDYRKAFDQGEDYLERASHPEVAAQTAEAAMRIGEYDRAATFVEKITTARAEWLKALLSERRGDRDIAKAAFENVAGILNDRRSVSGEERALAAGALAKLGRFKDANQVYRDAAKSDPKNAAIKVAWGKMFAEKHNPADAQGLFREALEANHNNTSAMVGMAELAAERTDGQTEQWIERALKVNPNLAEAHLLRARNALEEDEDDTAQKELDEVFKTNPRLLEAWSLLAVQDYLQAYERAQAGAGDGPWVTRILKENPHYGEVFSDLGDFSLLKRQLMEGVEFYRRALALNPGLDDTRSRLGINLFRLGQEQEARKILEEAYAKDPFNIWTVNTLRLMDSFANFTTFDTPHFAVKLQKKESELLRPYVADLLEATVQDMAKRYKYKPQQRVTFEMYPDHEDFAVRTVGLPGLGALGATIGNVVAMDSPSARPVGTFHWGSTLWHEAAHVISIGITSGRVPRWFTEGLSVYEETQAHPGWGDPMDVQTIQALQQHKLLPLEDLNGAFVRPKFPGQVPFAYFQGGLICEFIVEKYGFPKILTILNAYARGRTDAEGIKDALGLTLKDFDTEFLKYAREQTYGFAEAVNLDWASPEGRKAEEFRAEAQKNPRNYFARMHLAAALAKESKFDEAIREAQAAKELFPLYTGRGSPYHVLADVYDKQGMKDKAAAELQKWKEQKGRDPETFKRLARLQKELGQTREAIATMQEALYISIFDREMHDSLGAWYLEASDPRAAVREYQAALALNPPDKAGAHYNLANAYKALEDNRKARQEVLAALEIAPGFRPAQKLLLELSGN